MAALIRARPWSRSSLGPLTTWPQSLRTVVRIMLTSRSPMWMGWGGDLTFFYNDAYRATLGDKHAWALGSSARDVWQEIWPDIGPRIEHVLNTGEATWDEALLLFLERREYPEETYHTFSYSPLADDDGAIAGMLCVVSDETERIIEERRLTCLNGLASDIARTNTRTDLLAAVGRQLGAASKDLPFTLTYLFDEAGRANLACTTGVEPGHVIAPPVIETSDPDPAWPVGPVLADRRLLGVADLSQRFGAVPTGGWDRPPREALIAPIVRQGQGSLAGFLVAAINPYRPSGETNLRFINLVAGQLASGLANADAYDEACRRAEALAEIDRAETTFFSNVSHEFRTPLTLMLGPLEELISGSAEGDREARQALAITAHRNALRLLKLVNSLLDFSRIEAGRLKAAYRPTDLAEFTAEIASSFRSAVEKAGMRLIVDCPPLPQPVHVDRDMWEKIVLNLLSNAFKFTFDGELTVSIRPALGCRAAELCVRDTGIGIPPGDLPRLFERFHRVEGRQGRSFEGSGIGLALVQELARLHGAVIAVQSEVGRGSTFTLTIPFGVAHLPADQIRGEAAGVPATTAAHAYVEEALGWLPDQDAMPPDPSEIPSSSSVEDLAGLRAPLIRHRVLLADDNADMRNYVRRLLAEQGYAVEAVADGEAALAAARREKPDLILSDVMMPRLDGFGLVQALRHDPALREVPIVLLSARAGEAARAEGIERGADDYLTKPFAARELLARVRANIQIAQLRNDAVEALRSRTIELETVLATVPAAVWFTNDPEGRHISGNRQAASLLRLPVDASMSLAGLDAASPGRRVFSGGRELTSATIPLHRALRGEEVQGEELDIKFDDGAGLTLLTYASPLRDATGRIVGAVCAGINTSGRKLLEERFRCVVEASPTAMVLIGATGQIELVNTQAERVFGYERQALLGQQIEMLLPERYRRHHPEMRADYFADPAARPMGAGRDLFGRKKDGTEFPVEIGLSPIETDEGPKVLSAVVDLSERVSAARALAQSEVEFRASFEAAAVGKALSDPVSRRIVRANRAFAHMLGHEPEALIGRQFPDFIWHEDMALDAADFASLHANADGTVVREMRYVRRDGTPFWTRTSATIARTDANDHRGIVVRAIEDIDTRYRAEASLVEAKKALEQVVEQRTEALGQRDLLLREVYHRVKNNLQLVDSLLMMQGRQLVDPQARDALLSLRGRVYALGLVHQQLMGSADLKTFDVVPFLEALSTNLMDSAGRGGVSLSIEACTVDIGLDLAIPLGLLVTELVTNSLKHAFPEGKGTISIILRRDSCQHMTLIVADDGIGRAGNEAIGDQRSGLGTRIIARLVEQLEGQMTMHDDTGSMTEIRFVMPRRS